MIRFLKKVWDTIGMWVLISPFIIVPAVSIILGVVMTVSELSESKVSNVDDAYYEGYSDGYADGIVEGKKDLGSYTDYRFDKICSETDIEDALATLILYEDGEALAEDEISHAIWVLDSFYADVCDMVNDIENQYDE